jgi:hypothetical protein
MNISTATLSDKVKKFQIHFGFDAITLRASPSPLAQDRHNFREVVTILAGNVSGSYKRRTAGGTRMGT